MLYKDTNSGEFKRLFTYDEVVALMKERQDKASSYLHTQDSGDPSTTWTINHNLNSPAPVVQAVDGTGAPLTITDIDHTSANQTVITFAGSESGKAFVVG